MFIEVYFKNKIVKYFTADVNVMIVTIVYTTVIQSKACRYIADIIDIFIIVQVTVFIQIKLYMKSRSSLLALHNFLI